MLLSRSMPFMPVCKGTLTNSAGFRHTILEKHTAWMGIRAKSCLQRAGEGASPTAEYALGARSRFSIKVGGICRQKGWNREHCLVPLLGLGNFFIVTENALRAFFVRFSQGWNAAHGGMSFHRFDVHAVKSDWKLAVDCDPPHPPSKKISIHLGNCV